MILQQSCYYPPIDEKGGFERRKLIIFPLNSSRCAILVMRYSLMSKEQAAGLDFDSYKI